MFMTRSRVAHSRLMALAVSPVWSHWTSTHLNFQGKTVSELRAGTGFLGLTAALLGVSRVLLTDVQPLLPGLLTNVEAKGLKEKVEVRKLVWGSDESMSEIIESNKYDVVLMSDMFPDPEDIMGLDKTLKRICGEDTEVWAAIELRPWIDECLNQLMVQGFQVVELLTSQLCVQEGVENSNAFAIFQITPPLCREFHISTIT